MAAHEGGQFMCDAAVFIVQSGVEVTKILQEFKNLMGTISCKVPCNVFMVYEDDDEADLHGTLAHELCTTYPSIKQENITSINAPSPVQSYFAIKQALDSRKLNSFVFFSPEESLSTLLVVIDAIFTSAYDIKIKLYGGSYVDIPAILATVEDDTRSSIKTECSRYITDLTIDPGDKLEIIQSKVICSETFVHGFSTRKGGCSFYPSVASLNLVFVPSKKDPLFVVEENRRRLLNSVGAPSHRFEMAKAVHGNTVWIVGTPQLPGYDAIVCDKPGVVIAAPAADCVTIILADNRRRVCAAIHSGWKGTLASVLGAAVTTMIDHFRCDIGDITAAIGPSIGSCCYEVGTDVEKLFYDNPLLSQCVEKIEDKSKRHLNLQKVLRLQLLDLGVTSEHVDDSPSHLCTYCNKDRFYSYRRDGRPFGTHVGFIGLKVVE